MTRTPLWAFLSQLSANKEELEPIRTLEYVNYDRDYSNTTGDTQVPYNNNSETQKLTGRCKATETATERTQDVRKVCRGRDTLTADAHKERRGADVGNRW